MKTIEISTHSDAINVMRSLADKGEIIGDQVGLRFFRRKRLPIVLRTGTDRDASSKIYKDERDFRDYQNRAADKITYMRVVNFRQEPPISMSLTRTPSVFIDNMNYLSHLSSDECQILYDLQKLWRVADNEFWFIGSPLQAAIATLVVNP